MKGATHLTAHLLTPVLIDASNLQVTAIVEVLQVVEALISLGA